MNIHGNALEILVWNEFEHESDRWSFLVDNDTNIFAIQMHTQIQCTPTNIPGLREIFWQMAYYRVFFMV